MFHGKKISPLVNYSRLHPSTTLTEREGDTTNGMETQRQRNEEEKRNVERKDEGNNAILFSVEQREKTSKTSLKSLPGSEVLDDL